MYIHDATERAYKNGYKAGIKKFEDALKENIYFVYIGDGTTPLRVVQEATIMRIVSDLMGVWNDDN